MLVSNLRNTTQKLLTNLNLSSLLHWNWFDSYFCTIKSVKYVQKKKQWPNQLENFGLVGIALSPTNLQQKQYRQINCQNCIIDSNIYVQQSEIFSLLSGLSLQLLKVLHNCEDHFHFNSPNTIHTICLGQPGRRSRYLEFKELRQWKSEKGWQYLLINSNR